MKRVSDYLKFGSWLALIGIATYIFFAGVIYALGYIPTFGTAFGVQPKEVLVPQVYNGDIRLTSIVIELKNEYKDPRSVQDILSDAYLLNGVKVNVGGIIVDNEELKPGQTYYIHLYDLREEN